MRKFVIFSLAVLLMVGLVAGGVVAFRGPGFMGHGFRGHMGGYGSDYDSYNNNVELSEEEKFELREQNLNRGTVGFRSNNSRGRTGFGRTGFRGMMGSFFGGGSRSGTYCR